MHELAIAESVIDAVLAQTGERPVRQVRLEVGRISGVSVDSLRFCFELAAADTGLVDADLDVVEPEGRARCGMCGDEFVLADRILLCACGSSDLQVLSGEELKIISVTVGS